MGLPKGIIPAITLVCASTVVVTAQTAQPTLTDTMRIAQATRVNRAPLLDGTLNDPVWQQANPVADFRQREPYEGQPASENTEVRILYTRDKIFFGIENAPPTKPGFLTVFRSDA